LDLAGLEEEDADKPAAETKLAEPDAEDDKTLEEEKKEPEAPKWDWSLMDQLVNGFIETPSVEMLPVLCGYFNKVLGNLLTKEKGKLLEYLLVQRQGAIFDGLMQHMQHHSLALLMIELLQIQIKPEATPKSKAPMKGSMYEWENSDGENNDEDVEEGTLTPQQEQMKDTLAKKGNQIVMSLLDTLSSKNKDDLEKTLNANTILMDFCENDACFGMLTSPEALQRLIQICCQGAQNHMNLPYALNLLSTIINEFSNTDKEISEERKMQIQQLFAKFFPDMAYNCVMILYAQQPGESCYVN
jgi:hypothetical protein